MLKLLSFDLVVRERPIFKKRYDRIGTSLIVVGDFISNMADIW